MIVLHIVRNIASRRSGQHEQRIDDQEPYPLDADSDHDRQQRGEDAFNKKRRYAAAAGKGRIDGEHEQLIENPGPDDKNRYEYDRQSREILRYNAQQVANQIRRKLIETATSIEKKAYENEVDVSEAVDLAEREILNVGKTRRTTEFRKIQDVLNKTQDDIEQLVKRIKRNS